MHIQREEGGGQGQEQLVHPAGLAWLLSPPTTAQEVPNCSCLNTPYHQYCALMQEMYHTSL